MAEKNPGLQDLHPPSEVARCPGGGPEAPGPAPLGPTSKDPWIRKAWISVALLVVVLVFLSVYNLGDVQGGVGIHQFMYSQQYVLLAAVPLGLAIVLGFVMSVHFRLFGKYCFLWSVFAFFLFQQAFLSRFLYFTPFLVWCSGFLPNPWGWGVTLVSAGITTYAAGRMSKMLADGPSRKRLARFVVVASIAIALGSSLSLSPIFYTEWRKAPAVLDDGWEIAWEFSVPSPRFRYGSGFWFASRQEPPRGLHPIGRYGRYSEAQRASETEEAVFLTDHWMGMIRLSDGRVEWGKELDFDVSGDRPDELSAYVVQDRVHVIVRASHGDIYTFSREDGELLWEAKDLGFKYGPIGDLRVGAVPGPHFILATYADGRPGYMVIDSETGQVEEHALPVPVGKRVAVTDIGGSRYILGPAVLEGDSGALAIAAYFVDDGVETVPDYWGFGSPYPEEGYLFGIDRETGEVVWQVAGVGNWRRDLSWPPEHLWFDGSTVVWLESYDSDTIRVYDAATGGLRWSKTFPGAGARTCVHREGVLVSPSEVGVLPDEVILLDIQTGEPRWKHKEDGASVERLFFLGDACVIVTAGDTISVKTLRIADGSTAFSMSGLSRYDIYGIQDGDLVVHLVRDRVADVVRVNPETGEQAPHGWDHLAGSWELATQRYLLTRIEGWPGEERTSHRLFKAKGELQLMNHYVYPVQTYGSAGEVTREGSIIVVSRDEKAGVYRVYCLRFTGT
ncbi:MAG TPA: PQQ-binding-like beta-propeller repeat protein [Firmicutes bacterium]|nr:PQQ-binding-like beta-propeller repeat protein [Candidatus Fermentithermobacillaceae bacterium]